MMKTVPHTRSEGKLEPKGSVDFLFMRHAESQDNSQHVVPFTGGCKGLTEFGFEQAKKAATHLKNANTKPTLIFASPLLRARQTAQIVSEALEINIIFSKIFQEQNLGSWEGRPWAEIMPLLESRVLPPHGETYNEFNQRMDEVIAYLAETKVKNPLIIAHGGIWYGLATKYNFSPLMMPSNAEIRRVSLKDNVLTYKNEFFLNETNNQTK